MMTADQLKNSILQLAMQGKLVEQRLEDGSGEDLYEEIQKDRQRQIKEGIIKQNLFEDVTNDGIPYDVPDNWKWVKLGNIVTVLGGKRIPAGRKLKTENTGHIYIRVSDMKNASVRTDNLLYVPEDIFPTISRYIIKKEDIYITVAGTIGAVGTIPEELDGANLTENADRLVFKLINKEWLVQCLQSAVVQNQIADATTKVGQPKLAIKRIQEFIIPLPPLAEQKRIVAMIEELMPFVDQYAEASTKLNTLNTSFTDMMKKSVLQEAVQGKLVPQDPNDEPASELLKRITEEKKMLIKAGQIKKEKMLQAITEDEIPFDIPESWEWVRLGSILKLLTDGTHRTPRYQKDGVPFISVKDMSSGTVSFANTKYISEEEANELNMRCNPEKGDVLLSKVGTTGVPAPVDTDVKFSLFVSVALLKFNTELINKDYLINVIQSPCVQKQCAENTRGVGNKNWVMRDIANTLIPLAPLNEQERIVVELQHILPAVNELGQRINKIV